MPYKMTFNVKSTKKGWPQKEFNLQMPVTLDDEELILERYGSVERMIDRANAQHAVDVARGMRQQGTPAAAQAYAEGFVNDGRKSVKVKTVVVDNEAAKESGVEEFSESQMEYLRSIGALTK